MTLLKRKLTDRLENERLGIHTQEDMLSALHSGNLKEFARICDEEGFEPPDRDAYSTGILELQSEEEVRIRQDSHEPIPYSEIPFEDLKYLEFLDEVKRLGDATEGEVRRLLPKYFAKFRETGKTPISGFDSKSVWGPYRGILKGAEERHRKYIKRDLDNK